MKQGRTRNPYALFAALILLAAVGWFSKQPLQAQVLYGSIIGTVSDPSGAVIPDAKIQITNTATGLVRDTVADGSGRFSIINVLAGSYDLRAEATGFRPYSSTGISVSINTVTRADVKLEVGGVTEAVTVAASAALLQTDKSDVHTEIQTTALTNLPLPGYRNYQTLINLVPGSTPAAFQNAVVDTPARALTTNVNGTARNNNNTLTDGAANVFIWLPHHTVYVQPVESIETVNITTGSFDAEQGMAGGAAITVATKSGTNDLHGSAFWFHGNQHLNSGAYVKSSTYVKPVSAFNQAGGTIGGPIKKDKLFYFFSFERTWERNGLFGDYGVPPADFRRGDFSAWKDYSIVYDPATMVNNNPATRTPFPNNVIPGNRISPIFSKIQQMAPAPNQISPTDPLNLDDNFGVGGSMKLDRSNYDVKGNWAASPKLMIWSSYSRMDAPVAGKYAFGDLGGPEMGTHGFGDTNVNIPRAGFTYTFSPTFLMDGVFGYSRFDQEVSIPGQDQNVGLDVWGIPGTNGGRQYADDRRYGGVPHLADFGFDRWGVDATWAPLFRNDRSYTYTTNFSKIWGAHEVRFGYDMRRHEMNHWQPETANPRGRISFSGGSTVLPGQQVRAPNSYGAALLGLVNEYTKSIQFLLMKTREWQHAWYFRDRWQATRKLTLNLGLRYEYYPLINRGDRGIERWDPYTNIVTMGGLGNVPWENGIKVSKKLFAPRVGFAYRVTDDWVVRSGYGITYDPIPFSRPLRGLYPATLTGTWNRSTAGADFRDASYGWYNQISQGIPDVPTPDISTGVLTLPLNLDMGPRSPWGGMLHRGYIQSWNFSIERKLPFDAVGSVAYVGTKTVHQLLDRDINATPPGTLSSSQRPLALLYGKTNNAQMWDGIGNGSYHALQATFDKNFSRGLFMKGSYTWSKALSMQDDTGWAELPYWDWEPMINRNYAPAGYDRTHMFTMAWVYELPFGNGRKYNLSGIADTILGGWRINGMFSAYTGTPINITASGDSVRCFSCQQTADVVGRVRRIDNERGPGKPFLDPAAFADPLWSFNASNPVYRFGTLGRNAIRGPGFWRLDPMISKIFSITERFKAEFRAEANNGTNTPRWNNPNTSLGQIQRNAAGQVTDYRNFMAITGAGELRVIRLGLRLSF
ncbi:MAG: TonB-dependent receptor [Bryobacteraceae bacterium]|nr:TonB-dependent receptor [Bryobacterales bacterium]NUN01721.1 TonB-dependent receptor [Bryobacteraceae bacterium]